MDKTVTLYFNTAKQWFVKLQTNAVGGISWASICTFSASEWADFLDPYFRIFGMLGGAILLLHSFYLRFYKKEEN